MDKVPIGIGFFFTQTIQLIKCNAKYLSLFVIL